MGRTISQVAAVSGHRSWSSLKRYTIFGKARTSMTIGNGNLVSTPMPRHPETKPLHPDYRFSRQLLSALHCWSDISIRTACEKVLHRPVCAVRSGLRLSLAARQDRLVDGRAGVDLAEGVWLREPVREMTVFADQFGIQHPHITNDVKTRMTTPAKAPNNSRPITSSLSMADP